MNLSEIRVWEDHPVTKKLFRIVKKHKLDLIDGLLLVEGDDEGNALLQLGKIIGKIQALEEFFGSDISEILREQDQETEV